MVWGDGFEIETVINCRFAAAGVAITEVPSVEKLRMFGESNLRAVQDGIRVLRTLVTEWRRARVVRRMERKLAQPSVAKAAPVEHPRSPPDHRNLSRNVRASSRTAGRGSERFLATTLRRPPAMPRP